MIVEGKANLRGMINIKIVLTNVFRWKWIRSDNFYIWAEGVTAVNVHRDNSEIRELGCQQLPAEG